MATVLLAVLIALLIGHTVPDLARLRDFRWFENWLGWWSKQLANKPFWQGGMALILMVGLPVLTLAIVQWTLHGQWWGLLSFLLAITILFYCWGPRDLDLDVAAINAATEHDQRLETLQQLSGDRPGPPLTLQSNLLVDEIFLAALSRWFAVLLWFLLLGAVGALAYRLFWLMAKSQRFRSALSAQQAEAAQSLLWLLDWPAAQLMTLALALAADFDAVVSTWRNVHGNHISKWFSSDPDYLTAAARASIDLDPDAETEADTGDAALAAMQQAMTLIWRILVVWLAVLALLVLAGKIS